LEDEHDVLGHTFLRDEHLLGAVDDEVATLVVAALLRLVHDGVLVEIRQVAELRAHHDGNFSNWDLFIEYLLFFFERRALFGFYDHCFDQTHIYENFSLIGQTANARLMRPQVVILVVVFLVAGCLVDLHVAEENVVNGFFILVENELLLLLDRSVLELVDNLLHTVLQEAFERLDLLRHQAVHLEVTIDDLPAVLCVDLLLVTIRHTEY